MCQLTWNNLKRAIRNQAILSFWRNSTDVLSPWQFVYNTKWEKRVCQLTWNNLKRAIRNQAILSFWRNSTDVLSPWQIILLSPKMAEETSLGRSQEFSAPLCWLTLLSLLHNFELGIAHNKMHWDWRDLSGVDTPREHDKCFWNKAALSSLNNDALNLSYSHRRSIAVYIVVYTGFFYIHVHDHVYEKQKKSVNPSILGWITA